MTAGYNFFKVFFQVTQRTLTTTVIVGSDTDNEICGFVFENSIIKPCQSTAYSIAVFAAVYKMICCVLNAD